MVYCAWYTFTNLAGFPAAVSGKSMQPTLNPGHTRLGVLDGDWVWVNCWRVPQGHVWAEGDNWENSVDSNM